MFLTLSYIFAGVSGLCCDGRVVALLESICVLSFALLWAVHLVSVDEETDREAQRGHVTSEEAARIHEALLLALCCCAVSRGSLFIW